MTAPTRPASLLVAATLLALGLAGCQSSQTRSSAGYGSVETWPSYQASRANRGGD